MISLQININMEPGDSPESVKRTLTELFGLDVAHQVPTLGLLHGGAEATTATGAVATVGEIDARGTILEVTPDVAPTSAPKPGSKAPKPPGKRRKGTVAAEAPVEQPELPLAPEAEDATEEDDEAPEDAVEASGEDTEEDSDEIEIELTYPALKKLAVGDLRELAQANGVSIYGTDGKKKIGQEDLIQRMLIELGEDGDPVVETPSDGFDDDDLEDDDDAPAATDNEDEWKDDGADDEDAEDEDDDDDAAATWPDDDDEDDDDD